MKWFWEPRGNNEFLPPQIATFLEGWSKAKADVESPVPTPSEVFVREVTQNFVDAARTEQQMTPNSGIPTLTFRFIELTGSEAKALAAKLDLSSLSERYSGLDVNQLRDMRLPKSATVMGMHEKLKLLIVSETNTCGMYGQWERSNKVVDAKGNRIVSRMRDALLASVRESAGKGLGAFGEGKKAVMAISAARTLFAYTCFDPQTSTDEVSRRFMGGVYWQNHEYKSEKFSGLAVMGGDIPPHDVRPAPLVDKEADSAVMEFGIPGFEIRNPKESKGTTYLFVDHITSPEEVAESISRNWWPLIEDGGAHFKVIREDGSSLDIRYSDSIKPFVDAYRATESKAIENWSVAEEGELAIRSEILTSSSKAFPLGELKLAIDLRPVVGWSRKDPETNTSIVALIRDGMIVSYQHYPKNKKLAAPFVRGIFRVSPEEHQVSHDYLRSVEPPLHNKWQEDSNQDLDPEARKVAKEVSSEIMESVRSFREEYLASTPSNEQDFEIFRENLSLSGGKRVVPPAPVPPKPRTPWSMLSDVAEVIDQKNGRREAVASRTIELSKNQSKAHNVRVQVGWQILEDGRWVDADQLLLATPIEAPDGWDLKSGEHNVFVGKVTNDPGMFKWKSRHYRELWTLRPYMNVTSLEILEEEGQQQ
jgi:predicted SnoaL-like aldol condensation-catalyzing enzyme